MADDLKINKVTYPGVEAIAATNENGEAVMYYPDAVRYNEQELTDQQKQQARANIEAVSREEFEAQSEEIANYLPKNQGSANVGKILTVGTDGNLTLTDMPEGGATGDVVGTLDESNNILLSGNLADGTYTLKYENEDGTYTEIGTLEVGAIVTYAITQNLTNVTSNNSTAEVTEGESFTATLTASSGYNMGAITVTMGGIDITSSAVSGSVITIASVTGDVVITATASQPSYTNLADPTSADWWAGCRIGSDGTKRTDVAASHVSNPITLAVGDVVRIQGLDMTATNCGMYNASGVVQSVSKLTASTAYFKDITVTATGAQATWNWSYSGKVRFCGKLTGTVDDIIITKNEPIA